MTRRSMRNYLFCLRNFAVLLTLTCSPLAGAADCPSWLASMKSPALATTRFANLCDLYTAFESAQARIHGHSALRLRGVLGPRLVNLSSDYLGWLGTRAHGDPWWIYSTKYGQDPTPEVFSKWQDAALWIDSKVAENWTTATESHALGLAPIDVAMMMTVHTKAFHGLVDWGIDLPPDMYDGFRQGHVEFGYYYHKDAITEHTFDHLKYPVDAQGLPTADSHPMGEFHPIHCLDESPRELTAREEALVFPNGRMDSDGKAIWPVLKIEVLNALDQNPSFGFDSIEDGKTVRRQCGFFTFLAVDQIPLRTAEALESINQTTRTWYQPQLSTEKPADPLRTVARLEHWLLGIHPFNDGNGRTVRLLADYLLRSLGLPTPLYWTTWNDLNYSEEGWAEQIAQGMERTQNILEGCADYLEGKPVKQTLSIDWKDLCTVVPMTPSPKPW